jgi:hypothetical protein
MLRINIRIHPAIVAVPAGFSSLDLVSDYPLAALRKGSLILQRTPPALD